MVCPQIKMFTVCVYCGCKSSNVGDKESEKVYVICGYVSLKEEEWGDNV
jgi:hypothetical protein